MTGLGLGTPGSSAAGNFLAESGAANANTIANLSRSDAALRQQGELGAGGINANLYSSYLNAIGQARGQNISGTSNILGQVGNALGQEGQLGLGARGQDISALLQSKGMSLDALKAASQQGIDIQSLFNQYQGMGAQNQLGNKNANIDALSRALGIDLSGQQLGENARQFNTSEQGNTLMNLLQQYMQLSGKGISQRQVVQTPGLLQTVLGGAAGIAGAVAPFAKGGFSFGGGGSASGGGAPGETPTYQPSPFDMSGAGNLDFNGLSSAYRPIQF